MYFVLLRRGVVLCFSIAMLDWRRTMSEEKAPKILRRVCKNSWSLSCSLFLPFLQIPSQTQASVHLACVILLQPPVV